MSAKITTIMLKTIQNLFDPSRSILRKAQARLPEIKKFLEAYQAKPQDELTRIISAHQTELTKINSKIPEAERSTVRMRRKLDKLHPAEAELYSKIQEIMPEVYAILALTTRNKLGIMHFDVQLLAGAVLASGQKLVEMKTGEGKTMTFQLPLFLYGLTGKGAHLVTVNDYLAKRDGEYAGHIFGELGVQVGVITPQASYKFVTDAELASAKGAEAAKARSEMGKLNVSKMSGINLVECSKKEAYGCDVVYGTNNEFGFDYLRDNMTRAADKLVQRELYFCIVDEADSILIDEARTPLIISSPAAESNNLYTQFAQLVVKLEKDTDYVLEEKEKAVNLTDEGIVKMEKLLGVDNIWEDYKLAHHLDNALRALVYFELDKQYLVRDGEVMIVDEFTGRVLAGRRYSEGLHQAIEAKEGVKIQQESRTLATITFQNFFRIYKILTGGSGTVVTEQEEFFKIYNLEVTEIPTNKTMVRADESDRIYKHKAAKFNAVVSEIQEANAKGQPVLVGTTSISDSEFLSGALLKLGIQHQVLNAKLHDKEAQIVARAGEVGSVTVATNMAGRGTDIPLGPGAVEKGGLYVIGTERHEARRIDNQLRGRAGRQGDSGKTRFYVGLDDQIMRVQGGDIVKKIMDMANLPEDLPLESKMISSSIERAQRRMEGMYFDARKHVVEYDDVINQQREIFYSRRLRYLMLAEDFNKNYQITDKDRHDDLLKQNKSELEKQFKEAVQSEAHSFSLLISVTPEASLQLEQISEVTENILGLGNDQLLIDTANELRMRKDKLQTVADLRTVISTELTAEKNNAGVLNQFIANFLRTAVNLKINRINNHSGLIKATFLEVMDELWTLHLDYMQDIREGIGLRGIAQLDPLTEYKNEGFKAFSDFVGQINRQSLVALLQVEEVNISVETGENTELSKAQTNLREIQDILTGDRELLGAKQVVANAKGTGISNLNGNNSSSAILPSNKLSKAQKKKRRRK